MGALITEERGVEASSKVSSSIFARLLRWYRAAVTAPATEEEKAQWQQDAF